MFMKRQILYVSMFMLSMIWIPLAVTTWISGKDTWKQEEKINIEGYLPMILCHQIPWNYEDEMLKVQAVLARSSLYFYLEQEKLSKEILLEQVEEYWKYKEEPYYRACYKRMEKAVEETEGQVITYQGNVCPGIFHRRNQGMTRDGKQLSKEYGFLISVENKKEIVYETEWKFSEKMLKKKIHAWDENLTFSDKPLQSQISVLERDEAGYVKSILVGESILHGEAFREALGLSSSCFSIESNEDTIIFRCKGEGHGFGLSQYGGNELAKKGVTYEKILFTYFPDIALEQKNSSEISIEFSFLERIWVKDFAESKYNTKMLCEDFLIRT